MSATGTIFEIREFCLHDGPGIRTTVFFKGCPLRCAWCHNPEGLAFEPQLLVNKTRCAECGACRKVCPSPDTCTACGACVTVCPQGCRRLCGRAVTAAEVATELNAKRDFFLKYQGGVTFSGGEPLAQPDFLVELANRLRPIHLSLETSGYAAPQDYRRAVANVDLVLQDLKHPDPAEHMRYTGKALEPILENLAWLKTSDKPFTARIPLIPGVNDAPESLERFALLLRDAPNLTHVELLPYHRTAGAKYALLGRTYEPPFDHNRPVRPDPAVFERHSLRCRVP